MKNSADQGGCYPQRPRAEVDNTLRDLQNSSYPKKAVRDIDNFVYMMTSSKWRPGTILENSYVPQNFVPAFLSTVVWSLESPYYNGLQLSHHIKITHIKLKLLTSN